MSDQEPVKDDIAEQAGELILEADEQYQQNKAEQEAFLETVAQEEGAEVLETTCNLVGEYVVDIKAKLSGDIMDRMGALDDRVERIDVGSIVISNVITNGSKVITILINRVHKVTESDPIGRISSTDGSI